MWRAHNVWRIDLFCRNATLTLGSRPRQGLTRLQAKIGSLGVKESVREWTLALPRELPLWEFGVLVDSRIFKERLQGSKPNGLKSLLYHWKFIKRRYLKWAHMTHLDIWNTSYGQKKGWESNWQFDSRPLKVGNWPDILVCDIPLEKISTKATTLLQTSFQSEVCTQNYGAPKL